MDHISLKKSSRRCSAKSPTVQDVFQPIQGLISMWNNLHGFECLEGSDDSHENCKMFLFYAYLHYCHNSENNQLFMMLHFSKKWIC